MKLSDVIKSSVVCVVLISAVNVGFAENIDPNEDGSQYAYGQNVGWVNFEPNVPEPNVGATVSDANVLGYVWAENIGWISLSCENTASCGTVNYSVINDGSGNLSGYAWGQNVGWMNFNPTNGGVTIDADGNFDGWAWGENIGWINFQSADLYGYNVQVCVVNYYDLANFVDQWLKTGPDWPVDLYSDENVDFKDYSIFAGYWLDYCPDGWPLK